MRLRVGAVMVMFALLGGCGMGAQQVAEPALEPTPEPTPPPDGVLMRFEDSTVAVEIAADPEHHQRGLMFREDLDEDAGMLFIFPAPKEGGFWMKNTLIPLSIAYMSWGGDSTFEVLSIVDMEPCRVEDCPNYPAGVAFDAALEVNQGWFEEHGVTEGSEAELEGDLPTPT
ncbi:MAG: DUF192 domain-containing protein [Actinomycetota bacterium]